MLGEDRRSVDCFDVAFKRWFRLINRRGPGREGKGWDQPLVEIPTRRHGSGLAVTGCQTSCLPA
jgi:hypothetical protein